MNKNEVLDCLNAICASTGLSRVDLVAMMTVGEQPALPVTHKDLTEERNLAIVQRYEAGHTIKAIAADYGITHAYISQIAKRYGASRELHMQNRQNKGSRTPERDAVMCERYLAGETLGQLGKAYGVTRERIRQILNRAGIEERHNGFFRPERVEVRQRQTAIKATQAEKRAAKLAMWDAARAMYDDDYTYAQISEALGRSIGWVQQAIWKTGGPEKSSLAGKMKKRLTDDQRKEIAFQYSQGVGLSLIGVRFDLCPEYAGMVARKLGAYRPGYGPGITPCNKRKIKIAASEPGA